MGHPSDPISAVFTKARFPMGCVPTPAILPPFPYDPSIPLRVQFDFNGARAVFSQPRECGYCGGWRPAEDMRCDGCGAPLPPPKVPS